MTDVPVLDAEAVAKAVPPADAIARVRDSFERYAKGEWTMPAKVYLDSPPNGDFRAMPARGDGLAILKWVTSFPHNPDRGLPVVTGALLLSDADTGTLLAIMDCAAVTSLRTGAAAAVSAQVLSAPGASSVGIIGCGVNGAAAAHSLIALGYEDGICFDVREDRADTLAAALGWRTGTREEAAAQDVVVTVTPGEEPVVLASDLRDGQHLAVLGADAHGKAEVEATALSRCRLFCDEWDQASSGGELSGAVHRGRVERADVTQIGDVIAGEAEGRQSPEEVTLFDSTGLAIQDLAIAAAAFESWRGGTIDGPSVEL